MARRVDVRLVINFAPSVPHGAVYRFKRPKAEVSAALDRVMTKRSSCRKEAFFLHPANWRCVTYESVTLLPTW